ncbi:hypothetical protein SISNIDRAFT_491934 [Sistotremastrum niveocremeum HHB9708]|uniref:Uncharacterized protein n=1 Tax=Sistotremastrum niveocremeum HHB9708 TaxID=1314777 RepID=A0A164M846_9AGAM|nr:hypothetical protein SISNIDRAFT_491934 [Sistotremastrum niveocremeum HHB9708]
MDPSPKYTAYPMDFPSHHRTAQVTVQHSSPRSRNDSSQDIIPRRTKTRHHLPSLSPPQTFNSTDTHNGSTVRDEIDPESTHLSHSPCGSTYRHWDPSRNQFPLSSDIPSDDVIIRGPDQTRLYNSVAEANRTLIQIKEAMSEVSFAFERVQSVANQIIPSTRYPRCNKTPEETASLRSSQTTHEISRVEPFMVFENDRPTIVSDRRIKTESVENSHEMLVPVHESVFAGAFG